MTVGLISWSGEKNRLLKSQRGLSFEDVENAVENGQVLDDLPHPDPEKYPGQRMLIVEIRGYVCIVPYVLDGPNRFLKTIYPSRRAMRVYRKETSHE